MPVVAVVKEEELPTPVEEEKKLGLVDFQDDYFCGPLYLDPEREFYQALGNKPIFSFWLARQSADQPVESAS